MARSPLISRWVRDRAEALRRRPLVALATGSDALCSVCGWSIEGEARELAIGLAHVSCAEGEHATRGGA